MLLEQFAIVDEGDTYINDLNPVPIMGGPGKPPNSGAGADKKADTSNDDSSDLRSREEEQ